MNHLKDNMMKTGTNDKRVIWYCVKCKTKRSMNPRVNLVLCPKCYEQMDTDASVDYYKKHTDGIEMKGGQSFKQYKF